MKYLKFFLNKIKKIIKGIFMKLPQTSEGNEKYDELLKGILFKEGINLGEILNEKEKIFHNIIDIFNLEINSSFDEVLEP